MVNSLEEPSLPSSLKQTLENLIKAGSSALQLLVKYLYLIILTALTLKSNGSHFDFFLFISSLFIFSITL